PGSDTLAAARPLAAALDLSSVETRTGSRSADLSILASHNVTAAQIDDRPTEYLQHTELLQTAERVFRPAMLNEIAPVHSNMGVADQSGLDRALANVLTPASERRGERSA